MRNATVELSISDETPRAGAEMGGYVPHRPQNLNPLEEEVCIENDTSFKKSSNTCTKN